MSSRNRRNWQMLAARYHWYGRGGEARHAKARCCKKGAGADARNRTEDPIITSRPGPCLRCRPSLHTVPYSATISTVSDEHVGKIVGKHRGRVTFHPCRPDASRGPLPSRVAGLLRAEHENARRESGERMQGSRARRACRDAPERACCGCCPSPPRRSITARRQGSWLTRPANSSGVKARSVCVVM